MRLYNRLRGMNEALPGLLAGIIIYGVLVELIGVWFVADKARYSSGLWIGIACALGMGIHIAMVLEDAIRFGGNTRMLSAKSALRYVVVAAVLFAMMYFHLGSLIPAFIGLLGLKISAYAQPFLIRLYGKYIKKETDKETEEDITEEVRM